MDLKTLYREVILDHYKSPRNIVELSSPTRQADCRNPSCGDKIRVQLAISEGVVTDVAFLGNGCAISQASASMMTEAIKGQALQNVEVLIAEFRAMVLGGKHEPDRERLGDLVILEGVAKLHARVRCAMCGWSALEAALEADGSAINLDHDTQLPASSRS
jgi:nitrogen fixation NifU-like protein